MIIHVQLQLPVAQAQKLHIAYLTSWHNSIFGYKLRTEKNNSIEAENLKLRTASFNCSTQNLLVLYKKCIGITACVQNNTQTIVQSS